MLWSCDDGNCDLEIHADTAQEAAQEYVDGGDWNAESTVWVHVTCTDESGEEEEITIEVNPDEPSCEGGESHDWQSPSLLGGLDENPGVVGHGGGVIRTEICAHCGTYRVSDSWAQDPDGGEQGLDSVEYRDADNISQDWLDGLEMAKALQAVEDATDLDGLLEAVVEADDLGADIDIAALNTFGGEKPGSTEEVWSWDGTRLLVSAGGDFLIIDREEG